MGGSRGSCSREGAEEEERLSRLKQYSIDTTTTVRRVAQSKDCGTTFAVGRANFSVFIKKLSPLEKACHYAMTKASH